MDLVKRRCIHHWLQAVDVKRDQTGSFDAPIPQSHLNYTDCRMATDMRRTKIVATENERKWYLVNMSF